MSYATVPPQTNGAVAAKDDTTTVVAAATALDFTDTASVTFTVTDTGSGVAKVEANTTGGGGSGAGTNLSFVTIGSEASLSAERVLTGSGRVSVTDGGANGNATLDLVDGGTTDAKLADMAARTLKGRSANSTGVPASIAGGGAGTYPRDSGSALAFSAITEIIQNLALSGDLSPAQITADQNDYNPTSLASASVLRLDFDAPHAITGIAGGADGRVLAVFNVSSVVGTLTDASASSSAANRFDFNGDLALGAKHAALLWYDSTSSRWRLLTRGFPFTAVPTTRTLTAGAGMTGTGDLSADRTFDIVAANSTITVNADSIQVATGGITGNEIAAAIKDPAAATAGLRTLGTGAAQACAGNDSRLSDSRAPSGTAGGSLAGTFPNPTIAAGAIGGTEIAAAIKDPAAATAGLRTLGTGAAQAAAGNDSRLSDTRTPTDGTVTTAKLVDANVTYAKIQNVGARSLFGRSANSSGVGADIAGGGAGTYASDDASTLAFRAITDIIQNLNLSGDLSPSQITATQNDYSPASLSTASVLRVNSDAARTVTGLAGGADGRLIAWINTGSFPITLSNQDAGSTAANRFLFGPSLVLLPNSCLVTWYDSTSSRWRRFAAHGVAEAVFALTDAATVAINRDNGKHQAVTLGGNRTSGIPTGTFIDGDMLILSLTQDGTGSRTWTHDTGTGGFEQTTTNSFPTLSTGAGKTDELLYMYRAAANKWRLMAVTINA